MDLVDIYFAVQSVLDAIDKINDTITGYGETSISGIRRSTARIEQGVEANKTLIIDGIVLTDQLIGNATKSINYNTDNQINRVLSTLIGTNNSLEQSLLETQNVITQRIAIAQDEMVRTSLAVEQRLNAAISNMEGEISTLVSSIADDIAAQIAAQTKIVTQAVDALRESQEKLERAVVVEGDKISSAIELSGKVIASAEHDNTASIIRAIDNTGDQLAIAIRDGDKKISTSMDNVANALREQTLTLIGGVAATFAAFATSSIATETAQSASLASIAGTLALAVGAITTFIASQTEFFNRPMDEWLGDIVAEISNVYYKVGQRAYERMDIITKQEG